jgi:hypothetical protein
MDDINRHTLMLTINFMKGFIEYAAENKMNQYNMCLMFAPNIFRDKNTDPMT